MAREKARECRCWSDWPNETMKHKDHWRCADDYKCVRKRGERNKTVCVLKEKGDDE